MDTNTLTLTILGRPASKKNSKQVIQRGGRIFLIPSKAYERFKYEAVLQISLQKGPMDWSAWQKEGLFDISCTFYQKGKLSQDGDNALSSILDVLQDAHVITDDKNVISACYNIVRGHKDWKTEIVITRLEGGGQI